MAHATAADLSHEQLFGHLAGDQFTAQEAAEYLEIPLPTLYGIVTSGKLVPSLIDGDDLIGMRGKPRPSDLVAQQPLGEAVELGRGRIARTPSASFVG